MCIDVNMCKVPKIRTQKKFVALEPFEAQQKGDLAFTRGEVLTILASRYMFLVSAD